jgi:hypothetical protein
MPSQRTLDDHADATARVPSPPAPPAARGGRLLDRLSSDDRKKYPMATGFLDYFPDACAVVSNVSFRGNEKHNPGQPLHWSRGKSSDHADCVVRHASTRHDMDGEVMHLAEQAWRCMADLQIALEKKYDLSPPAGAK